jgi:hypothetical protein
VFEPQVIEGHPGGIGPDQDRPAPASVTAVGSPFGNVLLTSEGHAPVASLSGTDRDDGFVDKTHLSTSKGRLPKFSFASGRAERFKVQGSRLRTEKITNLSRKLSP